MRVLVLGKGDASEHTFAWKLSQSPNVAEVFTCPGNMGTAALGDRWAGVDPSNRSEVLSACERHNVNLVVIRPEHLLVTATANAFHLRNIPVFGPEEKAARIEFKDRAKALMRKAGIPTAEAWCFAKLDEAIQAVRNGPTSVVVKPLSLSVPKDYLVVARSHDEAIAALERIFSHPRVGAGVMLEELLVGTEISVHAFCDGSRISMCPVVQDHKRAFDGDRGPMTGGMGAVTRRDLDGVLDEIRERIVRPMVAALAAEGNAFRGMLFPGIMLTDDGPKVIEWNCRPGDPETQCLLPLLDGDLAEICWACAHGTLDESMVRWYPSHSVAVCAAGTKYPGKRDDLGPITIGPPSNADTGCHLFQGPTFVRNRELWVRGGGRAATAVATSTWLEIAHRGAYGLMERRVLAESPNLRVRYDIGDQAKKAAALKAQQPALAT